MQMIACAGQQPASGVATWRWPPTRRQW